MRHARPAALDQLEDLLAGLRDLDGLREKNRGVFYRRSQAFLHFHEEPTGLFADVRLGDDFERVDVTIPTARDELLTRIRTALEA